MLKKLIFCWGLLLCAVSGFSQDLPERSGTLVTDYTNTLSADDRQRLENKLVAFNDSTSTQIAVVVMKSVGGYDINQYAALLGRKWGVGSKDKNNGIVVLVAIGDRKVSIQTGYGSEGAVPDGVTHDIIANDITPRFKAGDYYGGLDAGTDDLIKYMKGEYKGTGKKAARHQQSSGSPIGFIVIIVVFVLIMIFRNRGGGNGGHIIGSRGGASPFWWFLAGSALGRSSGGGWGGFSGGGGGDSGSGGFGGFGGGSFGGGGSSGSW